MVCFPDTSSAHANSLIFKSNNNYACFLFLLSDFYVYAPCFDGRFTAQFILFPFVQMFMRSSCTTETEREDRCNPINETNDTNNNQSTDADDADEIDNISLEILWQPQNDAQITCDVVFIHGLHGKSYALNCRTRNHHFYINGSISLHCTAFHYIALHVMQ